MDHLHIYPNIFDEENQRLFKEYASTAFHIKDGPEGDSQTEIRGLKEALVYLAKKSTRTKNCVYWGKYRFIVAEGGKIIAPTIGGE